MNQKEVMRKRKAARLQRQANRNTVVSAVALLLAVISFISSMKAHSETPAEPKAETVQLTATEKAVRYAATPEELETVAKVVYAEARGEGYDGMCLVAQCVLNTAEATGKRPDEVVTEPGQYARPADRPSAEAIEAVNAVFIDGYEVTAEPIRYFYAHRLTYSKWHETKLDYVLTYGGHKFFKEK